MFGLQVPAWEIVIRTAVVYLVILVGLRLAGKREVGQLTVIDLVVLLLISNAVQNAMLGARHIAAWWDHRGRRAADNERHSGPTARALPPS